jgi:HD-GYP domain-containing protein (c-di-GMP phosphodiesterase class II)
MASSHSAETREEPSELRTMRRRFFEATRRAELITLINDAEDERELGRALAEKLCEVFDAETAFIIDAGAHDAPRRLIATAGLQQEQGHGLLDAPLCLRALEADAPIAEYGYGLLGTGARGALLASFTGGDDRQVLCGVTRLHDAPFDEAETTLLEASTAAAGHALERIWAIQERERLIEQLKDSFIGTAEALANALEARDLYTADHARSIADIAVALGEEMGLEGEELDDLRYGAIFHDIGKIAIPDAILHKPGPLTDEEREEIERHPEIGEQIVAPVSSLSERVRAIVRHDHERWDGSGYPDGLRGEGIPLSARIVLVVDAYHAMISNRPYRKGMSPAEACRELEEHAGTQFDGRVVGAFLRLMEKRRR